MYLPYYSKQFFCHLHRESQQRRRCAWPWGRCRSSSGTCSHGRWDELKLKMQRQFRQIRINKTNVFCHDYILRCVTLGSCNNYLHKKIIFKLYKVQWGSEIWPFEFKWSSFEGSGYNYCYGPNHLITSPFSKSRHFCTDFKWFLTKWWPFVQTS